MHYGFYLPTRGPTATREGILALAREGERQGLHSVMIADHIVFPVKSDSAYPYTVDGRFPGGGDALETFSILGVVAGATEKLRLVPSVLVLPYRNPVLTAKMVASLDVLSGGRVTLGVGVGWLKEEFEALHSPDFERRGAVTDEWIAIFKQLWSQSPASFAGKFYSYSNIRCKPFPLQKPHPPIWVGGHSRAALRRTARHGDGWHPVGAVAASPPPLLKDGTTAPWRGEGLWLIVGWLITGFAASLGAPYWFALLQQLLNLRNAGPKPASQSGATKK